MSTCQPVAPMKLWRGRSSSLRILQGSHVGANHRSRAAVCRIYIDFDFGLGQPCSNPSGGPARHATHACPLHSYQYGRLWPVLVARDQLLQYHVVLEIDKQASAPVRLWPPSRAVLELNTPNAVERLRVLHPCGRPCLKGFDAQCVNV
ncbi:hypothetical protein TOPH_07406, partial [Tolypocladium ophioglossoides CBS 100239]